MGLTLSALTFADQAAGTTEMITLANSIQLRPDDYSIAIPGDSFEGPLRHEILGEPNADQTHLRSKLSSGAAKSL